MKRQIIGKAGAWKKMGTLEHLSQPPRALFFLFFPPSKTETTALMNGKNLFFFSRGLHSSCLPCGSPSFAHRFI